jgi:hypothetical protein
MKLSNLEYVFLSSTIVYIAFFTHPPPLFIQRVLSSPWGHTLALLGVLVVALKVSNLAGMFVGIAYLLSSNPTLEYFEDPKKNKKDDKDSKQDEQPKSGAPEVKTELKGMAGKILSQMGKDVKSPPPQISHPKPSTQTKEEFTPY